MKTVRVPLPEMFAIAATRAMLGAGIALLLCHRLSRDDQRRVGATLTAIGVATTFPLAFDLLCHRVERP